jgi:hypothetical protein
MKFFLTSAMNGENIDKMFYCIIEAIVEQQQTRRKKVLEEELDAPMTFDNLKSARNNEPKEGQEDEKG